MSEWHVCLSVCLHEASSLSQLVARPANKLS